MHARQAIRDAVKAQLLHQTPAFDRVFLSRVLPLRPLELPAVCVYVLDETVDPESRSTAPRELARTLRLSIEATLEFEDDLDAQLDAVSLAIEKAIHADPTFGGKASDTILSSTDLLLGGGEKGEKPFGLARLTYAITYYTWAVEEIDEPLDDLKTVEIRTSLSNAVHSDNQAKDRLTNLDT